MWLPRRIPIPTGLFRITAPLDSDSDWIISDYSPVVDMENHTVTVSVNHFSQYAAWQLSATPTSTASSPEIETLTPFIGAQDETLSLVSIAGSQFKINANVSFSNFKITPASTTFDNSAKIDVWTVKIDSTAVAGPCNVTVTNSDGGFDTKADAFYVNSKDVDVTTVTASVSPYPGIGAFNLTIEGSGLAPFTDSGNDWIKIINHDENFLCTGGSTSTATDTKITVQFSVSSSAPSGFYALHLYDSDGGKYFAKAQAVEIKISPYTGPFRTYVYPNPCKSGSVKIKVCLPGDTVTAITAKVRIYTITGEEVWTKTENLKAGFGPGDLKSGHGDENIIEWDLKNKHGSRCASGAYFYIVEAAGLGRKTGKIAIIR